MLEVLLSIAGLVIRKQQLEDRLDGLVEKRVILAEHRNSAEECLSRIHECRTRITRLRKDFLEKVLSENSYVQN